MIRLKTIDSVMFEIHQRIISNKPFDKDLKPYSKEKIENVIRFFEEKEDYEKCHDLSIYIKNRFNHEVEYNKKGKF